MATQYQFGIKLQVEGTQQVVADTDRACKGFSDMGREADRGANLANNLLGKLAGLASAYVGTQTIRQFIDTADAMNLVDGRLKSVIGTGADYRRAQEDIYRIAQQNNIALADTTTLYTKLYDPIKRLGGGTKEVADITEAFSRALRISGTTTAEASSATLQFAQAMGSGVLRGEEFNSVNEAAPRVIRALADSLGVSTGELRKMAEQGELTADVVGRALTGQLQALRREADGLPDTVGGAMVRMRNDTALLVREFDDATGSTSLLARGIGLLSEGIGFVAKDMGNFNSQGALREAAADVQELNKRATILRNGMEMGFYGPNFQKELDETNAKLATARLRFRELDQQLGGLTATQEGMIIQGKERERVTRMLADADKSLDGIRQQLSGTDKNYIPTLNELQRLRELGTIGEKEYVGLVTQLAEKNYKKATSTKAVSDADREAKKTADELASIEKRRGEVLLELSGFSKDYATRTSDLSALYASGKITLDQFTTAHDALLARQPAMLANTKAQTEASKAQNAEFDVAYEKMTRQEAADNVTIATARKKLEQIEFETSALKMTTAERAVAITMREFEGKAVDSNNEAYQRLVGTIREAVVRKEETDASIGEMKRIEEESKRSADQISQSLTDSLFRAWESGESFWRAGWEGVKNYFKTTVLAPTIKDILSPFVQAWQAVVKHINSTILQPIINSVMSPITGSITSMLGLPSAANAASNPLGSIGSIANIGTTLSTIGSTVGAWFGSGLAAGGGAAATIGGTSVGAIMGGTGAATAAAGGSGFMASAAAAGPYVLAAVAALAIAQKLFGSKGGPKISGLANTAGRTTVPEGGAGNADAANILGTVQALYAGYAQSLGGTPGAFTGTAFFAKDPKGSAMTQLVLDAAVNGKNVFSRNENLTKGNSVEDVGRSDEEFARAVADAQTRALLASLKATTFSDANIAAQIAAINSGGSAEQISSQIQAIALEKQRKDSEEKAAEAAAAAQAAAAASVQAVPDLGGYFGAGGGAAAAAANEALNASLEKLTAQVTAMSAELVTLRQEAAQRGQRIADDTRRSADSLERATQGNPWFVTRELPA